MLLILALSSTQLVLGAEIDRTATVASVHDGDTFTLTTGQKVRLADLNAPELGDSGADEATGYLLSLVAGKTVFLDVDDKYTTDSFGRLVCVVYVDYNSTHYLNVNEALIVGGYADAHNYDNEFHYNGFIPYLPKSQPEQPPSEGLSFGFAEAAMALGAIALLAILIALKKK